MIIGIFRDIQSGLDIDRPQYQAALTLAKSRGFDQLVVYRYDRSGRDDAEYMGMLRDFAKLGITLVSASGESPDPLYQKLAGVLAWDESRRISIRVTGSKMARFENGYWSSKPPFGFVTERQPEGGSILVPKQGEAELIPQMFEMYASGKNSLREVQRWLNANLVEKQKSRRGIDQILQSRVYLGEVPYGRYVDSEFHARPETPAWSPGKHQALVELDVFDRVQRILQSNKRSYGKGSKGVPGPSRGGPNARYLFTGLAYCGVCGSRFIGSPSGRNKWPIYRCGRKHTGVGCESSGVYEPRLRAAVIPPIEKLLARLHQSDVREAVKRELVHQQEETRAADKVARLGLAGRMERLEARLTRLENAYLDADLSKDRYLIRRDEIKTQMKEVRGQLPEPTQLVLPDIDQFFALADALEGEPPDDQEWREIVEGMVGRIVVEGAEGDGRKAPATIKVFWKPEYEPMIVN